MRVHHIFILNGLRTLNSELFELNSQDHYSQSVLNIYICITCTLVMDPVLVVVILSCMVPMSVASVGW